MKRAAVAILALTATTACRAGGPGDATTARAAPEPAEPAARVVSRTVLAHPDAVGLSGLASAGPGRFVVVPERRARLFTVDTTGVLEAVPLRGVPADLDVEGVAWLGGDVLLATEGVGERSSDAALLVRRGPDGFDVIDTPPIVVEVESDAGPSTLEPLVLGHNAGLEGICVAGAVFAAFETVAIMEGRRLAPLVSFPVPNDAAPAGAPNVATTRFVALTSETGKISALDCRAREGRVELLAIERHFEVSRLLRFTLEPDERDILEPEVVLDLVPLLERGENFEGLARLPGGRVALINDNDYGTVDGPSELVVLDVPALRP